MTELEKVKEKLEQEAAEVAKDVQTAKVLLPFLLKKCASDQNLRSHVLQEEKKWKDCMSFLDSKASDLANGSSRVVVEDEEVYKWLVEFYTSDEALLNCKQLSFFS